MIASQKITEFVIFCEYLPLVNFLRFHLEAHLNFVKKSLYDLNDERLFYHSILNLLSRIC